MKSRIKYIIGGRRIGDAELGDLLKKNSSTLKSQRRVMVHSSDSLTIILSLQLAESLGVNLYLCHAFFDRANVHNYARRYGIDTLITGMTDGRLYAESIGPVVNDDTTSYLYIFTTGTTGEPKLARHSWRSIAFAARHASRRLKAKTWLMAYSFTGYAGLQVYFSAQRNEGVICFTPLRDFAQISEAIVQNDVKVISATPTFWRMLINAWPRYLGVPILEQATLGGEVITQDAIQLIDKFFRPVGLTHIYASTEAGSVISVSDRRAGFPTTYLASPQRDVGLRVRNGILQIRAPAGMEGYVGRKANIDADGWIHTGDRVQEREGRIFFIGRDDSCINIGGIKVLPEEVEEVLNSLPVVEDCVVYSKRNPIIGAILSADVKLKIDSNADVQMIKTELQKKLPQVKIPQYIRFVEAIEVSENAKKRRS